MDHDGLLRVLLVEQPTVLAATMAAGFAVAGVRVEVAESVAEGLALRNRLHPCVTLLDVGRDDPARRDAIAELLRGDCGLIVVLAADDEALRVECLDRGADDVITRDTPFREVLARVRALHRRLARGGVELAVEEAPAQVLVDAGHRCLVGSQGRRTLLSEAEFVTLETLLDADGAPVSREWLGRVALKRPLHAEDRSVDQLVLKLRRKLTAAGAPDRTILSARRQGYVIPDPTRFRTALAAAAPPDAMRQLATAGA